MVKLRQSGTHDRQAGQQDKNTNRGYLIRRVADEHLGSWPLPWKAFPGADAVDPLMMLRIGSQVASQYFVHNRGKEEIQPNLFCLHLRSSPMGPFLPTQHPPHVEALTPYHANRGCPSQVSLRSTANAGALLPNPYIVLRHPLHRSRSTANAGALFKLLTS